MMAGGTGRRRGACGGGAPRSFTLVEMVAGTAVMVVVLGLLFHMLALAMRTWHHAETQADTFREARAALFVLHRDLENIHRGGREIVAGVGGAHTNFYCTNLAIGPVYASGGERDAELYALTHSRNPGKSSLCAVGYYSYWDERYKAPMLKRHFLESDQTFSALASGRPWFSDLAPALFEPTGADSETDEVLAPFVWGFRARAFARDDGAAAGAEPAVSEVEHSPGETLYFTAQLPVYLEIEFRALSPAGAAKIGAMRATPEDWENPDSPLHRDIIGPNSQFFKTRIPLTAP